MTEVTEGHTVRRYDAELNHLRGQVIDMGGLVLEQVNKAVKALVAGDVDSAREVVERDHEVDRIEIRTDEEAVELLARRAPMGSDLRVVVSISKVITDLERVGDEAVKIARMAVHMHNGEDNPPNKKLLRDVKSMARLATSMLRDALDGFDRVDAEKAVEIIQSDKELDTEFQSGMRRLSTFIMEDSRNLKHTLNIVIILKALERVGDHAKNIAEYAVYHAKGKDVRHLDRTKLTDEALNEDENQ